MSRIDPATIRKINDTANIVEVVSDYVKLTKRGSTYKGLCPFHNERTPSFSVNPARNFCYCFSCHKGGSPVNFIMEKEGLTYPEALRHLANRYGIKIEEREMTDEEKVQSQKREAMYVANEWAMRRMQSDMKETEEGRNVGLQYFYGRGVTEEAIKAFCLGYAMDQGDHMVKASREKGFEPEIMTELGILGESRQEGREGRLYDRFRGRVIFPILNTGGKVVGFGGRDLKGGKAKYINSPESPVYRKSHELYGLYQAKSAIAKQDKCFLVEGYMDVIGMWQSGMENVVASSGTALTDGQIDLIRRFSNNITVLYDGDAAGIKAALRGINMLLAKEMKVKVLLLPDGHDPDSFARQTTPEAFREYVEAHETDIIRFMAKVKMDDAAEDPTRRIEAVHSVVEAIAHIPDPIARNVYVQECALLLKMQIEDITDAVARQRGEIQRRTRAEQDRERLRIMDSVTPAQNGGHPSPVPTQNGQYGQHVTSADSSIESSQDNSSRSTALDPLERNICEIALKYGLLEYPYSEEEKKAVLDEGETPEQITVAEFIDGELAVDNLAVTHPLYARIFSLIMEMHDTLERLKPSWEERQEKLLAKERQNGIDQIASQNLTMDQIVTQERALDLRLKTIKEKRWAEFVREMPGRELASHEDPEIRACVNEMLFTRYELSRLFRRPENPEEDRNHLGQLVRRSVTEFKGGIIDLRISDLMERMRNSAGASEEELRNLQHALAVQMSIRAKVAKTIGERIVNARK